MTDAPGAMFAPVTEETTTTTIIIIIIIIIIISERRIARVWNLETAVVPVVIGALGSIPKNQQSVADEDLNNPSSGRCVRECCFLQ